MKDNVFNFLYEVIEKNIGRQLALNNVDGAIYDCKKALFRLDKNLSKRNEYRDRVFAMLNANLGKAYSKKILLVQTREEQDGLIQDALLCLKKSEKIWGRLGDMYNVAIVKTIKADIDYVLTNDCEKWISRYIEACHIVRNMENFLAQKLYIDLLWKVADFCIETKLYELDILSYNEIRQILYEVKDRAKSIGENNKKLLSIKKSILFFELREFDYSNQNKCRYLLQRLNSFLKKECEYENQEGKNLSIEMSMFDILLNMASLEYKIGEKYFTNNKKRLAIKYLQQSKTHYLMSYEILIDNNQKYQDDVIEICSHIYNSCYLLYCCVGELVHIQEACYYLSETFEIFKATTINGFLLGLLTQKLGMCYAYLNAENALLLLNEAERIFSELPESIEKDNCFFLLNKDFSIFYQLQGETV